MSDCFIMKAMMRNVCHVFKRNWDGQGIEIGSSALDHDGNVDPEVPETRALEPGESLEIAIDFQVV